MMNCEEISRLVSEQHDRELPLHQKLKIRLHLAYCVMCRRFSKQIAFVNRLTQAAGSERSVTGGGLVTDARLPTQAKSRMKKQLARR